jgi:hypothetical protein
MVKSFLLFNATYPLIKTKEKQQIKVLEKRLSDFKPNANYLLKM